MKPLRSNHAVISLQDFPNLFRDQSKKIIQEHGNKMEQNHQHTHNQSLAKMCGFILSGIRQHFGNKTDISAQNSAFCNLGSGALLP